ncbi:Mam1p [Saccharomyces paradoxus]|uniref:Mam1p n=1 Tax=Saccharomyces paradoxus TaxID=27291 RepID=A0A8B8UQ94_SACPA|nr:Mam1 [Saccharomyces paradoxus]QHS72896.1 Mam1 [Saccharomyces paradoxus]
MRDKSCRKRTIPDEDASYFKFPNKLQKYSRFLSRKISSTSPKKQPKNNNTESVLSVVPSSHREDLTKLKRNVSNAVANKHTQKSQENVIKEDTAKCLTRSNLKKLQEKIFDKELNDIVCDHCLCSTENRKDIKYSRLWFLFELEMSENWNENLRLSCYNKYVYSAIDKTWIMENILFKEQEKNYEYFPIGQLLIPNNIEYSNKPKRQEKIEDLTIEIDSIIEASHQKERFLPQSVLIKREKEIAFNDFQLDARKILNDLSATSENPFNSSPSTKKIESEGKTLEMVPKEKKNKKIIGALERKLHIDQNY